MADAAHAYERLAEFDGAMFTPSGMGTWSAKDRDGITIVRGAMSMAEAARLYCEDKGLTPSTPEAILACIKAEYRPYDTMPEFQEGFDACGRDGVFRCNPYRDDGVKAQAWDRGANAAMRYARALAHPDAVPADAAAGPAAKDGWLERLLRTGRCWR